MGARDLSIINTPPPNRYPIVTELHTFNEDIIKEAIDYEFQRNGQVFFIHNRVQNIQEIEILINKICPDVRTVIAHGQMDGSKLEKVMLDFINYDYDILIATTIIESGLDIPNANTIIINNAQNIGLSDLHQLRGRVGRSNKKAFCYLLAPPLTSVNPEARRRLKAIEEYSELGSGFNIAMQDLDIRGAGNLLGAEQSGFISDIGFETYHRILNEAILELKESSFHELYEQEQEQELEKQISQQKFITDCQIDTDLELLLPDNYINNISERIRLYRELDNIETEEKLLDFENQLKDRFGKLPVQTIELMNIVRLRWVALELGFEKIILKSGKMVAYFINNQESPYYKSTIFSKILSFIQQNPKGIKMKESKNKLTLSFDHVLNVQNAIEKIKKIDLG
jgi:transcription-repair coupling factor (superfamily II helicase)